MGGQLSFFSADAGPPLVEHAEGLLCGPGQLAARDGAVRVSVLLPAGAPEQWRAPALLHLLAEVDLEGETATSAGGGTVVRTAFDRRLAPLVRRWQSGARKLPPVDLVLDGGRLRWWAVAAGRRDGGAYALLLGASDEETWPRVGAALAAAGIAAVLVGPRAGGPAYRITGTRRLGRLAELVGPPPSGAPADAWPFSY